MKTPENEKLLALYIEALKEAFTTLKRRYRSDFQSVGRRDDPRWRQCAQLLLEKGIDPFAYMNFVFDSMTKFNHDVFPTTAVSPAMAARYEEERPARETQVRLIVKLQAEELKRRIDNGESLPEVLEDPLAQLSAVMRFAAAWSEKRFDLAAKFREDAERMLAFEPLYRKLLADWLPEELSNA